MRKVIVCIVAFFIIALSPAAYADAEKKEALKEMVALLLNSGGHLCATVLDINPLKIENTFEVTCRAYRGGNATKTYVFNAAKGTAFEQ